MSGVIVPDGQTAKALNDLARHQSILRILQDIRMDMEICEIEGWDKTEYIRMIQDAVKFELGGHRYDYCHTEQASNMEF